MSEPVVIGSSNTDMILQVPRIPRPGETMLGGQFQTAAGGKGANQAAALCRGLQLEDAVVYAQAAAALSVQCLGAQPSAPTRSAIDGFLSS
jgi:sugar/nucleoside kinase (ribokinase family)